MRRGARWVGLEWAVVISVIAFGAGHAYQGKDVVRPTLAGVVLQGLALLTGSILPGMLVHALLDVMSGTTGYLLFCCANLPVLFSLLRRASYPQPIRAINHENVPGTRNITIDNAAGNYVIVDLGHGRFALYAHLQTGSLEVKVGDTVRVRQVLALLGNSGNSDAPHLHFQLMDANSPLGSEGIPYELETFTQLGLAPGDPAVQDIGQVLLPKSAEKPAVHPVNNAIVTFP